MNFIDIYHIDFSQIEVTDEIFEILNDEEQTKAKAFHKQSDRDNYTISHYFLREVLSQYTLHVDKKAWEFELNDHGKPSIKNGLGTKLYFNLSHSNSSCYIICSSYKACGIDVEEIKAIELDEGFLELILSDNEKNSLKENENILRDFYTYWTLKEAHLKALGTGLSTKPTSLDFSKYLEKESRKFSTCNNHYEVLHVDNTQVVSIAILDEENICECRQVGYNFKIE